MIPFIRNVQSNHVQREEKQSPGRQGPGRGATAQGFLLGMTKMFRNWMRALWRNAVSKEPLDRSLDGPHGELYGT